MTLFYVMIFRRIFGRHTYQLIIPLVSNTLIEYLVGLLLVAFMMPQGPRSNQEPLGRWVLCLIVGVLGAAFFIWPSILLKIIIWWSFIVLWVGVWFSFKDIKRQIRNSLLLSFDRHYDGNIFAGIHLWCKTPISLLSKKGIITVSMKFFDSNNGRY